MRESVDTICKWSTGCKLRDSESFGIVCPKPQIDVELIKKMLQIRNSFFTVTTQCGWLGERSILDGALCQAVWLIEQKLSSVVIL